MRKIIATGMLALTTALGATSMIAPTAGASTQTAQRCHVHQSGKHWVCVTPGAFCPAKAHYHYGASRTGVRYECIYKGYHFRWARHS